MKKMITVFLTVLMSTVTFSDTYTVIEVVNDRQKQIGTVEVKIDPWCKGTYFTVIRKEGEMFSTPGFEGKYSKSSLQELSDYMSYQCAYYKKSYDENIARVEAEKVRKEEAKRQELEAIKKQSEAEEAARQAQRDEIKAKEDADKKWKEDILKALEKKNDTAPVVVEEKKVEVVQVEVKKDVIAEKTPTFTRAEKAKIKKLLTEYKKAKKKKADVEREIELLKEVLKQL